MALRQLVISKKIEALRAQLATLTTDMNGFDGRKATLKTREAELEASVNEVTDQTPDDDKATLDAATAQYEADEIALNEDIARAEAQRADLEAQINALQTELDELNARANSPAAPVVVPEENRKDDVYMKNRTRFFGMTVQERDAFLARDDVRSFLARVVAVAQEKRTITGSELSVPDIMLGVIRENIDDYSKLLGKVNVVSVGGTARENIVGSIPEAVWMEMIANYNEMAFALYNVEVDGYAVGGFIPIPNSLMKDSRYPALAAEIMRMIGAAIGLALDKAIVYGTGIKMPLGIVPRLAQTAQPDKYPATARPWADLHTSNILTVRGGTSDSYTVLDGIALFKGIASACAAAKVKFSNGNKFWVMSEATYTQLVVAAMSINATGAIVTGASKTMPIVGGDVILLDFIPDGEIVGGYGDCYLLAEREGMFLSQSEHVRFLNRQTVFAGEARYDGVPVIPEAFVAIAIDAGDVTTSATFATDAANPDSAALESLTLGTQTLIPSFSPSVTAYALNVANNVSTLEMKSVAKNAAKGATVLQKNGASTVDQGADAELSVGENVLSVTVTYGTTTQTYTIVVTRAAS